MSLSLYEQLVTCLTYLALFNYKRMFRLYISEICANVTRILTLIPSVDLDAWVDIGKIGNGVAVAQEIG